MPEVSKMPDFVRFDSFELSVETGELFKNGVRIRLSGQPIQVLIRLIATPGKLVTREELQQLLWPGNTYGDFERGLNAAVNRLRDYLHDSATEPKYIETVPGRGYRFIGKLTSPNAGTGEGKTVSHYRILEAIGRGGMGVVYKAHDLKLGRDVALKFLPDELATNHEALERFRREASAASSLNHPSICTIYEIDEHQGQPFIVMELLQGQTLREFLISAAARRNSLGPILEIEYFLDIAIQITEGLQAAHAKGVIHRDIKPTNIFITNGRLVKILDFGLAKLVVTVPQNEIETLGGDNPQGAEYLPTQLSEAGAIIGTAGYMAPEQARGEELDGRADLFSLGVVLYEMATGHSAFRGSSVGELCQAILTQTPAPIHQLNASFPPRLEHLINKALHKNRELRYQSVSDLRADLVRAKREDTVGMRGHDHIEHRAVDLNTPRYDTIPPLPQNFVPRPAELEALRQAILNDRDSRHVALVALREMGGVGKTVLAQALCRDREIQTAFPDGIIWIKVGQKPNEADLVNQMREAARVVGASSKGFDTLDRGSNLLRSLLKDKMVLLVLDDVWEPAPVYYFQPSDESRFCRLLFTTRNDEIAAIVGARSQPLDILDHRQSQRLLAAYAAIEDGCLPQEADGILRECHGLPLALAMIGAMLRNKSPKHWEDVLHSLCDADINAIKISFPNYAYPSLVAAIETSFNALEDDEKRCYLDFAVFPEDTAVPEAALEIAWGLEGKKVRQCMDRLVVLSLATRDDLGRLILHDLQLDYVRNRAGSELRELHRRLLRRYEQACVDGWHSGPDDGYFLDHLAYHLREAGQVRELQNLPVEYKWLERKLHVSGVTALISDFDVAQGSSTRHPGGMLPGRPLNIPPWRIVDRPSTFLQLRLDELGEQTIELLRRVKSALLLSAHVLSKDPSQLPGQLCGRLPDNKLDSRIRGLREDAGRSDHALLLPLYPSLTPPGGPLLRMFTGHTGAVNALAVTPDGSRIVSASEDQKLKVWGLASGQELFTLAAHSSDIYAVAITPDGRLAVSASEDRSLKVWELADGAEVATLRGHTSSVTDVAITPDGRLAVSACWDQTLKVWDLQAGREIHSLKGHSRFVSAVAVTPDGKFAVSASYDKTLKIWDLVTGLELRTLRGHSDWVSAVALTPDGKFAVSASGDQTLKIWELQSGREVRTLVGHKSAVSAVAVTPDGRCAVSGSYDQSLKVWDLAEGYDLGTLGGHSQWVRAVVITPDGKRAVSGSLDMTIKVWEFVANRGLRIRDGHSDGVGSVAVTSEGKCAVSASADMTLKVWPLSNGKVKRTLTGHAGRVNCVALVPDSNLAVSASDDMTVKVWDLVSGDVMQTLCGHTNGVKSVAVDPHGKFAVSGSRDHTVRVWELATGRPLNKLTGHAGSVNAVAMSPDGKVALSGSSDRTLKVWSIADGRELCTLTGHSGRITAVTVTPDGRRAVSVSRDRTVKVWDLASGHELATLISAAELITQVAITPSGELAVSGHSDKAIKVWELASGAEIATFTLDAAPGGCALSPDGKTIVVGDADGAVHFLLFQRPQAERNPNFPS